MSEQNPIQAVTCGTEPEMLTERAGADLAKSANAEDGQGFVSSDLALVRLWEENRRWVAAILLAHKPRYADLDDLLQEVALTVLRHGADVRDAASFRPWLRTVAINTARLAARAGKLRQHASIDANQNERGETNSGGGSGGTGGSTTPDRTPADIEEADRLMSLAMKIPEGYREPLLLKALRDLSYREIGSIMGLPETTIETRIARGRRMLRELATQGAAAE
jgi:RNA polymerase sigma-70 factor, ECF subfamily